MQNQVKLLLDLYKLESSDKGTSSNEELKAIEEQLDPSLLAYYRRIKARRGSGVAILHNSTCSKCRMVYPDAHEVVRCGHLVHKCEYCGRLLVARESSANGKSAPEVSPVGPLAFESNGVIASPSPCSEENPAAATDAVLPQQEPQAVCESFETGKPLILHVDDDREYGALLKKTLEQAGFSVVEARNGKDALEQLAMRKIDLIVSELQMPDHDGFELIEEINRRRIEIPVIFVAAAYEENSYLYVMGLGAYECLRKSNGEQNVLQIVRKAVSEQTRFLKDDGGKKPQTTILLVDSSSASRKAIRNMLEPHDYVVYAVANATEALQALSEYSPDLIISEARLSDCEGMDLLKKIRSRGIETEIIFLTTGRNWKSNLDLMNMGAFDFIDKPVDEDKILSVVSQALDESVIKLPVPRP